WFLRSAVGHWPRARGARAAEQNRKMTERGVGECRELLVSALEPEVLGIEREGASDVLDLVANAMKAGDEGEIGSFGWPAVTHRVCLPDRSTPPSHWTVRRRPC